jgi:hypothetical protein
MNASLRALLLALAAFVFALAGMSAGGGGDGGVWILPRSNHVFSIPTSGAQVLTPPRDWRTATAPKTDFVMQLPSEMGAATAHVVDRRTGIALPIRIVGKTVTIPLASLQALLAQSNGASADGLIVDANGLGLLLTIRRVSATDVRIDVW